MLNTDEEIDLENLSEDIEIDERGYLLNKKLEKFSISQKLK